MVPTSSFECGTLTDGYRMLHARVFQFLQQDMPPHLNGSILIAPAATTPFPLLYRHLFPNSFLCLADPSSEDLAFQHSLLGTNQVAYFPGGVDDLPSSLTDLCVVLNPYGLQHWRAEAPRYASAVLGHCRGRGGAQLFTLDWGVTTYPEDLAGLPGIANEIHFSQAALLTAYGPETGWRLMRERIVRFGLLHAVEEIAEKLHQDHEELFRNVVRQQGRTTVVIGSSVIYRQYEVL